MDPTNPMKFELKSFTITKQEPKQSTGLALDHETRTRLPIISGVEENSLAEGVGLMKNDVVFAVNRRRVKTWMEVQNIIKTNVNIRILVSRKRPVDVEQDMVRPLSRNRDPGCQYKMLRVIPEPDSILGLKFDTRDGKLAVVEVGDGWGKAAKIQMYDRPIIIGESEISTVEDIMTMMNGASGEPTDWVIERVTGAGELRLTGVQKPQQNLNVGDRK